MSDSHFVPLRPHALARAALVCASALAAAQDLPQVRITNTAAPVDADSPSAAHLRAGT